MLPARTIRTFLAVEAAAFVLAAAAHAGWLVSGYEHARAATAESVIAAVLLAGLWLTFELPEKTRVVALIAQGFALLGTLVGVYVVIIGIGPQTLPDEIYHGVMLALLAAGLAIFVFNRPGSPLSGH